MREPLRHRAIETFLREVDERLRRLPDARRAAERDELAQHLDLLVTAHRARGLDEGQAASAAVERFGRAERIGAELQGVWRSEQVATFDYAGWFLQYGALIAVPYLGISWFSGESMGFPLAFAVGNMFLTPALFYAGKYKRRRSAAEIGEEEHA
jgi:hypothetical protein